MTDRWVSFDCFGTLVDWHGGFTAILARAGARRPQELVAAFHRHEPVVESEPYRSYREILRLALERAMRELRVDEALPSTVIADEWSTLPVFVDTAPTLRRLRDDGWLIAVLTNCDVDLFAQTAATLGASIDRVITAQDVHSYKPAPAHFRRFRETIGDAPWIHVACSWFHDIVPARNAGIPRIWVDRDRTGDDPSLASRVLPNLDDLATVVRLVMR
ncbi:MAG: HAD family hydrolase [Candidatus Eremiobacteraeota bacterium]|nr:HAD family hydrolase [Candidatus Eremiobacteraeota bacterium]MBV8371677.1 HAD family hydrolase [Candidatus Eremiobacteraeota bacterium]